jgi:hypothetical protein
MGNVLGGKDASMNDKCKICGFEHSDRMCYRIAAIEYFENGSIKRIEYHDPVPKINLPPNPLPPNPLIPNPIFTYPTINLPHTQPYIPVTPLNPNPHKAMWGIATSIANELESYPPLLD